MNYETLIEKKRFYWTYGLIFWILGLITFSITIFKSFYEHYDPRGLEVIIPKPLINGPREVLDSIWNIIPTINWKELFVLENTLSILFFLMLITGSGLIFIARSYSERVKKIKLEVENDSIRRELNRR